MEFVICPVCGRHVRDAEPRCVFCSRLLVAGLCAAVAFSPGCKGRGTSDAPSVVPASSGSSAAAAPSPSQSASSSASAEVAEAPVPSTTVPPDGSIGLGNIGTMGVYGPPPQASDGGVPKTRLMVKHVQSDGGAVPDAAGIVGAASSALRRCYERALEKNPRAAGTVHVVIEVGKGGEVTSVNAQKSGTLTEPVRTCIAARMSALKFAAPEGGVTASLQFELRFDVQPL